MIVDDEAAIRSSLAIVLEPLGYVVTQAANVAQAQSLVSALEYDLILTDIVMPDGSGLDVLRLSRSQQELCPVVMITGSPGVESASEALRLGAFDYVSKPVFPEQIVHVVRRALEFRRLSQERERFRNDLEAIFTSVRDAIVSVDRDLRVVSLNSAATAICGIARDSAGKSFYDLELPCGRKCRGPLETAIHTRRPVETRYFKCRGASGLDEQYVSVSVAPCGPSRGQAGGAVMVVRDETSLYRLEKRQQPRSSSFGLIGKSLQMQMVYSMIDRLAGVPSTVLVQGENGTGKELIAAALHANGGREGRPFVKVNCAAIAETLLESELFGHVRGAFTGAVRDKIGVFEKANGGTLFLDEVGEISPQMQVKLLRVLQEREFVKVGGSAPVKVDVRIVAATNKELAREVDAGRFRQDLYYRLKVVELTVPALRDRSEDLPCLVEHFVRRLNAKLERQVASVSEEAMRLLSRYRWPGNVRELEHALEHAFIMCGTRMILPEHLPEVVRGSLAPGDLLPMRERIAEALARSGGNKSRAARTLNIDRKTLYRKMRELSIAEPGS
ncbi:sigma 54-interacting transcriptional regulator [Geomonas sp. Red32]|uniref:sigma-54 dependent transcriptional regulator n=1 Tax=Geomonas sp. Red32 TaxID=2912856 RepID=UPI00202D04B2|nr:sigma-54-dependent Fis family transcriptional regulator [Geomonas sp. Red32]MCM0082190.1 sigma 54-interacting transcriptional regulator [Geomonas sp. Red32]